ncbi:Non-specific serine/threonine protein kinase [Acanthopleuribacter pedis]
MQNSQQRLKIQRKLGEGAMGLVYEAFDTTLNRKVAVKILPLNQNKDGKAVKRFQREAQMAGALQHPNIIAVFDIGFFEEVPYFTMALMEGGSLEERLEQGLDWVESCRIIRDLADAVDYANRKGVIHRDIKPANVMFDGQGTATLVDFGIARVVDQAKLTATQAMLGTPYYVSPEQATGGTIGPPSDLYSLGSLFFQMLTGRPVFQADNSLQVIFKHIKETPPRPRSFRPELPAALDDIVLKLLQKDPKKRYQSGGRLVRDLEAQFPEIFGHRDLTAEEHTKTWSGVDLEGSDLETDPSVYQEAMRSIDEAAIPETADTGETPAPRRAEATTKRRVLAPLLLVALLALLGIGWVFLKPWLGDAPTVEPGTGSDGEETTETIVSQAELEQARWRKQVESALEELAWVEVQPGQFLMGSRAKLEKDERTVHRVHLNGFGIMQTEVTQALWQLVMREDPSCRRGTALPVEQVSWNEVQVFISKVNQVLPYEVALPTEAQWEFAARAGYKGNMITGMFGRSPKKEAWYADNSDGRTHAVAGREPNAWGIHDMLGNVWEWCSDYYGEDYYEFSPERNPTGPAQGFERVVRGGSFQEPQGRTRFANRHHLPPDTKDCAVGFRLVRVGAEQQPAINTPALNRDTGD